MATIEQPDIIGSFIGGMNVARQKKQADMAEYKQQLLAQLVPQALSGDAAAAAKIGAVDPQLGVNASTYVANMNARQKEEMKGFVTTGLNTLASVANDPAKFEQAKAGIIQHPLFAKTGIDPNKITPDAVLQLQAQLGVSPEQPKFQQLTPGAQYGTVDPYTQQFNPQGVFPKPEDTTAQRNYEYAKQNGFAGSFMDYQKAMQPTQYGFVQVPGPGGSVTPGAFNARTGAVNPVGPTVEKPNASKLSSSGLLQARSKLADTEILKKQIANLKIYREALDPTTDTGYVFGGRQTVTKAAEQYDKALDAIRTTVRKITRTPGEGSMSDWEGKLGQAQLPTRAVFNIETLDQGIAQLEELANGYGSLTQEMIGSPTSQSPQEPKSFASEAEALKSGVKGVVIINGRKARID